MKLRNCLVLATCLVILSCQSTGDTNQVDPKPNGIRGTYTNEKLRTDVLKVVYLQLETQDCSEVDSVDPYVDEQPTGDAGEMQWTKRWIVRGCGKVFDLIMHFQEDGAGSAYYHVTLTK